MRIGVGAFAMLTNVWIAISSTATTAIRERLQWDEEANGEYSGAVTDQEHKIFEKMADFATVERMFKKPSISGKVWHLFSLNFTASAKAKEALDFIAANRPNHFVIVGAWDWDGEQIRNAQGDIMYPIHPQLIKFMPDIITRDQDGNIISTDPATELTDVNLIQGQQPRKFT